MLEHFLEPTTIRQTADHAGLDLCVVDQLVTLAQHITAHPPLRQVVEELYTHTYVEAKSVVEPSPEMLFGEEAEPLYALIALDAVRRLRAVHQSRGIPEAVTRASSHSPNSFLRRYATLTGGKLGVERQLLSWSRFVATGDLYRLGRLEYVWQPFKGNFRVYQHRTSGVVQAVAEAGMRFSDEGLIPYEEDHQAGWQASLLEEPQSVTGTPVSPFGYAARTPLQLSLDTWQLRLQKGNGVLDMHIPDHDPLTLDLLKESLEQALAFFPRYHPELSFKAFVCGSWLFSPQLVQWLPPEANLLAFQRQGYLFPLPSNGKDGLYYVFGLRDIDLSTAPRDTRLRRAMIDHLAAGHRLRCGGFFLLPEDVPRFGDEPYRTKTSHEFCQSHR